MADIVIAGIVSKGDRGRTETTENVTVGGENVTVSSTNVTVTEVSNIFIDGRIKFLTLNEANDTYWDWTFHELNNVSFIDFASLSQGDGEDYTSFLETGNDILGDPTVDKYGSYMYTFLEQTTPDSSCRFRLKWEWADDATSNKWTDFQEAYRNVRETPSAFEVIQTRHRIRGNGKAVRVRFESSSGQDMRLLGWAIPFGGVPMA